jgi:hypothetical protein
MVPSDSENFVASGRDGTCASVSDASHCLASVVERGDQK